LAPAERVHIYAGMYFWRIVEALREDFPKVATVLGADGFAELVRGYIAAHPSTEPSIRHVGHALPEFLGGYQPAYLADLARLESMRLHVFDAPDAAPLTAADLRRVAVEEWPDLRFTVVPACARLVTAWPVHRLWADPTTALAPARSALRPSHGCGRPRGPHGVLRSLRPARLRSPAPHAAGRGRRGRGAAGGLLGALARGRRVRPPAGLPRGVGDGAGAEPGNRPGALGS